ncbi:hypothetical protein, partial [Acrocarpospora sp. B8E8]|uniref:zinc ribbon domain-containing protein n=1 Tax=Acrocarpospora sp. B8E8 TaxID=3153572 RepID=UPI00325CC7FC
RQQARAARRAQAGLPVKQIHLPGGERLTQARGKRPARPHRHDRLSRSYRRLRARDKAAGARRTAARRARARQAAATITSLHGTNLVVEDCHIAAWHRRWGKACAAFTPGQLLTALAAECTAAGGALLRAATRPTALSQHCLCGTQVTKTLGVRVHACPACGLTGDRDLVSAALAALVVFSDPADPGTAAVDYDRAAALLTHDFQGLQEALSESTVVSPVPAPTGQRTGGTAAHPRARRHRRKAWGRASARRSAGTCGMSTPDELRPAFAVQGPRRSGMPVTPDCPDLRGRS